NVSERKPFFLSLGESLAPSLPGSVAIALKLLLSNLHSFAGGYALGVVGHRGERTCAPSRTPFAASRSFPFRGRPRRDFSAGGADGAEDFPWLVPVDAFGTTSKRTAATVAAAGSADN